MMTTMELKKTPLYQKHIANNAHMVDFGGWAMPLEYESILKEAKATRVACGLFDVSHMGEIEVKGLGAFAFLQRLTPNDISLTKKGQLQYNLFLNKAAGAIDDLMVYNFGNSFLCVVNASNTDKVYKWLKENQNETVDIANDSSRICLLSLQGPAAYLIMEQIFGQNINSIKYMHFTEANLEKVKIIVSRSGYTGEDGFEMYIPNSDVTFLWDLLLDKGKNLGLKLCGLGARDVLRIEAGYPLYGHEINDSTNPIEASLEWAVKFNKDFIGKEQITKAKKEGVAKKRVGFIMQERAIARQGYQIFHKGNVIGEVTSGTYSVNLDKFIGMAYLDKDYIESDVCIEIKIRDKFYQAKVSNFNFIKVRTKK